MAKKSKEKKDPYAFGGKKRLDISALSIVDNIVFSKTDRWAYYRISNSVYDFLSNEARISVASQIINAFANLMSDRQDPLDCHMIIASTPVDVDAWESQVRHIADGWNKAPGFDQYISDQAEMLRQEEYLKKVTYLGIHLGRRGAFDADANSFVEAGLQGAIEKVKAWMQTALQTPGEIISAVEEREARARELDYYRTLSTGNLKAEKVTAEELLLVIKRQFYPSMRVPYLDVDHESRIGPGDMELELGSAIFNRLRWLQIDQMVDGEEYSGHRACLTIARLPRNTDFPYGGSFPFMYFLHKLSLPFTSYARFTLHPNSKMKKELEKKKKEQKDELENVAGGGNTVDAALGALPQDVTDALADMQVLTEMLSSGKNPWVEGVYRIVVETPDESTLKKYCTMVKQKFSDLDITVNWTVGDQAELFLEQMPGDKMRGVAHKQLTDLVMFGTSGFSYSGDVGDHVYGSDGSESAGVPNT